MRIIDVLFTIKFTKPLLSWILHSIKLQHTLQINTCWLFSLALPTSAWGFFASLHHMCRTMHKIDVATFAGMQEETNWLLRTVSNIWLASDNQQFISGAHGLPPIASFPASLQPFKIYGKFIYMNISVKDSTLAPYLLVPLLGLLGKSSFVASTEFAKYTQLSKQHSFISKCD